MPRPEGEKSFRNEGNFLRKSKRIFNISRAGNQLIDRLAYRLGINRSSVIEVAIRRLYKLEIGEFPDVSRTDGYYGTD